MQLPAHVTQSCTLVSYIFSSVNHFMYEPSKSHCRSRIFCYCRIHHHHVFYFVLTRNFTQELYFCSTQFYLGCFGKSPGFISIEWGWSHYIFTTTSTFVCLRSLYFPTLLILWVENFFHLSFTIPYLAILQFFLIIHLKYVTCYISSISIALLCVTFILDVIIDDRQTNQRVPSFWVGFYHLIY